MNREEKWRCFQVACVYIGTVVGAGFASGREIYQFFVRFGNFGYVSIIISTILFAWLGFRMMDLGRRLKALSFRDVNAFLFGRYASHIVDTLSLLMLFGVTVAMLAGAGELFQQSLHIHFQIGVLFTVLITFLTLIRGISGILGANTLIVPAMVSFVLYAGIHTFIHRGLAPAVAAGAELTPHNVIPSLVSCIVYTALNIGLSAGVLIPLGTQINNPVILRNGARLGAIGLGGMLICVSYTLLAYAPGVWHYPVPMAQIATNLGDFIQWGFLFVLWGEIFSTLVGNVYGLSSQFTKRSQKLMIFYTASLLFVAVLCSQIGFSNLVAYGYTIFGWVSLLMLLTLVWPRKNLPNP